MSLSFASTFPNFIKDYFTEGSSGVCVWGIGSKQNTGVSKANSASSHIWLKLSSESILKFSESIQHRWRENHDGLIKKNISFISHPLNITRVSFYCFEPELPLWAIYCSSVFCIPLSARFFPSLTMGVWTPTLHPSQLQNKPQTHPPSLPSLPFPPSLSLPLFPPSLSHSLSHSLTHSLTLSLSLSSLSLTSLTHSLTHPHSLNSLFKRLALAGFPHCMIHYNPDTLYSLHVLDVFFWSAVPKHRNVKVASCSNIYNTSVWWSVAHKH